MLAHADKNVVMMSKHSESVILTVQSSLIISFCYFLFLCVSRHLFYSIFELSNIFIMLSRLVCTLLTWAYIFIP